MEHVILEKEEMVTTESRGRGEVKKWCGTLGGWGWQLGNGRIADGLWL